MEINDSQETPKREDRPDHLLSAPAPGAEGPSPEQRRRKNIGWVVAIALSLVTLVIVAITIYVATVNPNTHDASVGANYIGVSPQVSGRIVSLPVKESACVQKGTLLVRIDPHDYESKLQKAESDQQDLEAQIRDRKRQMVSSENQASSSYKKLEENKVERAKSDDEVGSSRADVRKSNASVDQALAKYRLSELTVERNRPLYERRYISKQQFDQYLTDRDSDEKTLEEAEATLTSSKYKENTSEKDRTKASVSVEDAAFGYQRDRWSVPTLDTLIAQRPSKAAAVEEARTDLERTRIFAPVNGCVTALNSSQGAYAKEGSALFTLIDSDSWYITAAYRESDLRYIRPNMRATVYLMSDPNFALTGYVQSIGNAVQSSDSSSVGGSPGTPGSLPMLERSMNWVRLASRYPVRIRFTPRDPSTLRIGTTANVTMDY